MMIAMGPGFCSELVLLALVVGVYFLLIFAVAIERLVELVVSKRNAKWAFANGGKEFGREHYPVMVIIHTALLVGCVVEVWLLHRPFLPWLGWPMLAIAVGAQVLRWWCITTLGQALEHPGDRAAGGAAGAPRTLPLAAPPELCCGGGRGHRLAADTHRVADRDLLSPWPTRCC